MSDGATATIAAGVITLAGVVWTALHGARVRARDNARDAFYAALQSWDKSQSPRLHNEVPVAVRQEYPGRGARAF